MEPAVPSDGGSVQSRKCCGNCVHFCNAPAALEAAFAGLTAMSSGHASVRAHDGLCNLHEVYLSYRDYCASYSAAVVPAT